jgi:hypothetical protein
VLAIQAFPHEPPPWREAIVGSALGVFEGRDGLPRDCGTVVGLYARSLARTVAQPEQFEHPIAHLTILVHGLQQVGPVQREQLARIQGAHRSVAWRVGEQGRLPEQGAGT